MFHSPDSIWLYAVSILYVAPHVTISVGGATAMPRSGATAGDLVRLADGALYQAKASGRNRVNHVRVDTVS